MQPPRPQCLICELHTFILPLHNATMMICQAVPNYSALKIVAVIAEINFLEKEEFLLTLLIKLMLCYPTLVDKIGLSTCY